MYSLCMNVCKLITYAFATLNSKYIKLLASFYAPYICIILVSLLFTNQVFTISRHDQQIFGLSVTNTKQVRDLQAFFDLLNSPNQLRVSVRDVRAPASDRTAGAQFTISAAFQLAYVYGALYANAYLLSPSNYYVLLPTEIALQTAVACTLGCLPKAFEQQSFGALCLCILGVALHVTNLVLQQFQIQTNRAYALCVALLAAAGVAWLAAFSMGNTLKYQKQQVIRLIYWVVVAQYAAQTLFYCIIN